MERLTIHRLDNDTRYVSRLNYYFANQEDAYINGTNKLGQLEDIEQELGIELSVLFKALKQEYIFGFTNDSKKFIYEFPIKDIEINVHEKTLDVYWECSRDLCKQFKLKDYGKTWALTKEELEK